MPWLTLERDGLFYNYKQGPDGQPDGEALNAEGYPTREAAQRQIDALYASEPEARKASDPPPVKAISSDSGEMMLDVLGVPYSGPFGGKDSHGEYFTPRTELWLDQIERRPVIYYHGFGEQDRAPEVIGEELGYQRRPDGVWFRVKLDPANRLARRVWEAAKLGLARASSGALSHLVRVAKDGRLLVWPIGEISLLDTREHEPANPYAVAYPVSWAAAKSAYERAGIALPDTIAPPEPPEGGSSTTEAGGGRATHPTTLKSETPPMNEQELMALIQARLPEIVSMLMAQMAKADGNPGDAGAGMTEEEKQAMMGAMAAKAAGMLKKDTGVIAAFKAEAKEQVEAAVKAALDVRLAEVLEAGANAAYDTRRAREDAALKAAQGARQRYEQAAPAGAAKSDSAGGVQAPGGPGNGTPRITGVSEDLRYAHLSHAEMALGIALRTAPLKALGVPYELDKILSEGYLRHAAAKAADWADSLKGKDARDYAAVKAVIPWKASELNASDISGQGSNWVETALGTTLWEKARSIRMYKAFIERGMMEEEVPPGASAVDLPLEGNDPIAYSSPQANDVDATGRPEATASINPFSTGNATLTPGEIKIATAHTVVFEEDSIIRLAPTINRQLNEKAEETIEQLILNGDTVTTASTNLNLIDGTPATGVLRPYYLASNGMLKYPIITNTAYSRSGAGALDIKDYLRTRKLLPKEIRDRLDKLMFVVDSDTNQASLALPELTTQDVNRYATIEAGEILKLWGVPYFVSGFIELANSAGKVPAAGGTLGRILAAYPPYWKFAFRRAVGIETDRDILSGTSVYVASFRLGIAARGAGCAAVSYNVGVTIS